MLGAGSRRGLLGARSEDRIAATYYDHFPATDAPSETKKL